MYPARANLFGILAILMWSTLIGLVRSVTEAFGVDAGTASMYSIGAIALCIKQGLPKISKMPKIYILGCGALFVIYEILLSQSIGLSVSSVQTMEVGMLNYLWPCAIVILSIWINKQKLKWWVWPGILLSLAGIFWCMTSNDQQLSLSGFWANVMSAPLPYFLAFMAAWMWGLYCNLSRRYFEDHNAISLFFIVLAVVLWVRFFMSDAQLVYPGVQSLLELLFIGVIFGVSYSLWEVGIHKGNMLLLAILSYFTPVFSMLFAGLWLKTIPGTNFWLGVGLVVAGSFVCWLSSKQK